MFFIPSPKTVKSTILHTKSNNPNRFIDEWNYRKTKRNNYLNLGKIITFFVFLTFAGRISYTVFFSMFDNTGYQLVLHKKEIKLPSAVKQEALAGIRHLDCAIISVDIAGAIHYQNTTVNPAILKKELIEWSGRRHGDPHSIGPNVILIIDKDCNMEHVHKVFAVLKEIDKRNIMYLARSKNNIPD